MNRSTLKHLLQGRALGHPLHPMLVHLPIGLWVLSFVLDVIALTTKSAPTAQAAMIVLVTGVAVSVLTMVTGFADFFDIRADHPARRTATWHMVLNLCAVAVFGVSTLLRLRDAGPSILPTVISAVGVILISISGYLGGVLVYDDGIGVGRHRRTHDIEPTQAVSEAPDNGYVDVLDAEDLAESTPVRVEANGHVMVLVRIGSRIHAVQEFCTHRCGPLSEGQVREGNIVCPWHRSSFEMTSGKVVDGPAKVELKTYLVREDDGRILVRVV